LSALSPTQLIIAAALSGFISLTAGMLRLLSFSGALAAFVIGFLIFGFGGVPFAVPLLAFFLSSSLLSRLGRDRKKRANALYDKTSTRDAGQVLANGAVAALLALAYGLNLHALTPRTCMLLFLAALASVNADTWATEIGGLSSGRPYLLSTFKKTDPGVSGAVSLLGTFAALLGAAFIIGAGWLAWPHYVIPADGVGVLPRGSVQNAFSPLLWRVDIAEMVALAWAGFVAAFADSILGASVQAQYRCIACGAITERKVHCNGPTVLKRGFRWITNDVVNLLTSILGVLFAWILLSYFGSPH
jgi:uncharacterized protein (TIGR00297 family)